MMIARIWTGRTRSEDVDAYLRYVHETGVTQHLATPGNRGSWLLHRSDGHEAEVQVISLWESEDCIKAFAGEEIDRAVYYPEDERYLLEMTPTVTHYEILDASGGQRG